MFCVESNPPGFGFQTLVNCVVGGLLIRVIFILFIPFLDLPSRLVQVPLLLRALVWCTGRSCAIQRVVHFIRLYLAHTCSCDVVLPFSCVRDTLPTYHIG